MATDDQIATAFNAGYTIQKIDPNIAQKLLANNSKENEISQAMVNGIKQSQKERIIQQQQAIKERQHEKKRFR